jgi:hypothetical protein
MHPMFVKLFIDTGDDDDLVAEEEARRRAARRSPRARSVMVASPVFSSGTGAGAACLT